MAFVPVPNVVRVALIFADASGNQAVNVIHLDSNDTIVTLAVLTSMGLMLETWAEADWVDAAAIEWRLLRAELRSLDVEEGLYLDYPIDATGAAPGDALPSMNTIAVSLRSAFVGRSRRGRLYHVGLSEGMVDGDELNISGRATILNTYNALLSAVIANEYRWVVVSYVENGQPRANPLVTPITSIILADNQIDQQVRRRPNR